MAPSPYGPVTMTKSRLITGFAAGVVALLPAAAAQASPHDSQYGNPVRQETPPKATAGAVHGSDLPFTGLEIGLIVAGGGAAAGAGLVLRRTTRGHRS